MSKPPAGSSNNFKQRLSRFPASARVTLRDELHRIRLQLEALGLAEAETDVRRAILSASESLEIPHYLSVRQVKDFPERHG